MQNDLLTKYPKADIRVYAIWFSMMAADWRDTWPADLLTDPRVVHRWDETKTVGTFFGQRKADLQSQLTSDSNGTGGAVLWDSYLLYGPAARWETFPTALVHWGRTIVSARETLKREFDRLYGAGNTGQAAHR